MKPAVHKGLLACPDDPGWVVTKLLSEVNGSAEEFFTKATTKKTGRHQHGHWAVHMKIHPQGHWYSYVPRVGH
jgi:hypothetical protein